MGRQFDTTTCVNCGKRRRVNHRKWNRAAVPRCFTCGGRVEPSNQATAEHIAHEDYAKQASKRVIPGGHIT